MQSRDSKDGLFSAQCACVCVWGGGGGWGVNFLYMT